MIRPDSETRVILRKAQEKTYWTVAVLGRVAGGQGFEPR